MRTGETGTRSLLRVEAGVAVVAALAAVAFAFPGAEALIRDAYARTSLPIINDLILGQGTLPVDFYLSRWARARPLFLTAVLGTLVGALATVRWHPAWARVVRGALGREPVFASPLSFLGLGALLGWYLGAFEVVSVYLHKRGQPSGAPAAWLWVGPLAGAMTGIVLAGAVAALSRVARARAGASVYAVTAIVIWALAYSATRSGLPGVHPLAALVLAGGIGIRTASLFARYPQKVGPVIRKGGWIAGILTAAVALAVQGPNWLESGPSVTAEAADGATAGRPNVLLLILDTTPAARMSTFGYGRATTPNIDAFGARGVIFERAIAPSPWTLPSHAAMLTGLWTGDIRADWVVPLEKEPRTLGESLAAQGYPTGAFVANWAFAKKRSGLDRGFETYSAYHVGSGSFAESIRLARMGVNFLRALKGDHRTLHRKRADQVNREFLSWRAKVGERPYFAMLNYYDAHDPYDVRAPWNTAFASEVPRHWHRGVTMGSGVPEAVFAELVDAYDASLAYLDSEIGNLLNTLEELGDLDNTVVIITADHGEQLGERGLTLHGNSLYMPLVHVPLLVAGPGVPSDGRRVGVTASIRDIPATVEDLLGLPGPDFLPGGSLARFWQEPSSATMGGDTVFLQLNQWVGGFQFGPINRGPMVGLVQDNLFYIRNGDGVEEVYDLDEDPTGERNLVGAGVPDSLLAGLRIRAGGPGS